MLRLKEKQEQFESKPSLVGTVTSQNTDDNDDNDINDDGMMGSLTAVTSTLSSSTNTDHAPVPRNRLSNWSNKLRRSIHDRSNRNIDTNDDHDVDDDNYNSSIGDSSRSNTSTDFNSSVKSFERKVNTTFHMANNFRRKIIPPRRRVIIPLESVSLTSSSGIRTTTEDKKLVQDCTFNSEIITAVESQLPKNDDDKKATLSNTPVLVTNDEVDCDSIIASPRYPIISSVNDTTSTTMLSTSTPNASSIQQQQSRYDSITTVNTLSTTSTTIASTKQKQQEKENAVPKSVSSTPTMALKKTTKESAYVPLDEAIDQWITTLNELKDCPEMSSFVHSTLVVTSSAIHLVLWTATLPITIPYNVCTSASSLVWNSSVDAIAGSASFLTSVVTGTAKPINIDASTSMKLTSSSSNVVSTIVRTAVDIPVVLCWTIPITVLDIATDLTSNIVTNTLGFVGLGKPDYKPDECTELLLNNEDMNTSINNTVELEGTCSGTIIKRPTSRAQCDGDSKIQPSNDFLDRLRLDFQIPNELQQKHNSKCQTSVDEVKRVFIPVNVKPDMKSNCEVDTNEIKKNHVSTLSSSSSSNYRTLVVDSHHESPIRVEMNPINKPSRYLLRVSDVDIQDHNNDSIGYLDLSDDSKFSRTLLKKALDRLIVRGLSMLANHPPARLSSKLYTISPRTEIKWNPLNSTKNLLCRMSQMTDTIERVHLLEKETLIWSGDYVVQKGYEGYGRNFSMYLARGIVGLNPRDFMRVMWNDAQTKEYNQYSNGRSTELCIDGTNILESDVVTTSTKAIRSETKVPLTKFTVEARCLMHVRALDAPDDGFVILSRSLDSGDGGIHYDGVSKRNIEKQDNQILWGINVLKYVPNHPNLTDLISLSHVSTPNVPGFFGRRIAVMGIEDFFKNIRKLAEARTVAAPLSTEQ